MSQFNPVTASKGSYGVPTQVIQSKKRRVVCRACEPHVWFVLVVDNEIASPTSVTDAALQSTLQSAYTSFRLLHGRVQLSLDQRGGGGGGGEGGDGGGGGRGGGVGGGGEGGVCGVGDGVNGLRKVRERLAPIVADLGARLSPQGWLGSDVVSSGGNLTSTSPRAGRSMGEVRDSCLQYR